MNLPADDEFADGERASQDAVRHLFGTQFIVRVPDVPPDRGADGSIEIRRFASGYAPRATGRRAWFQLKHVTLPNRLDDGSVSDPIDTKNINYLRNYACPFYLLFIRTTGEVRFRWWRDIVAELNRGGPGWQSQQTVTVRFSRTVDVAVLEEIATEIDVFTEQAAQLLDGPQFARDVQAHRAQRLLEPQPLFVGRLEALDALERCMTRGSVVPVVGAPGVGKRELVRHCLSSPARLQRLELTIGSPLALLVLDAGRHIGPRVLRALAFALGVHKVRDLDVDDVSTRARNRALLLNQDWPGRAQGQHVVAVIEGAHGCLEDPEERQNLDEFLSSAPFRGGCALVVSRWGEVPDGRGTRNRRPEVKVDPLSPSEASALLDGLGVGRDIGEAAVKAICDLPEALLPGLVRLGASMFEVGVAEGRFAARSEHLVDQLLEAAVRNVRDTLAGLGLHGASNFDATASPLVTLFAMCVLGSQVISETDIRTAGLLAPPISRLRQVGWVRTEGEQYRLTALGWRCLRGEFERLVRREAPATSTVENVAHAVGCLIVNVSRRTAEPAFDEFAGVLEEAIAWTRESGMGSTKLEAVLLKTLVPYSIDDAFFPASAAEIGILHDKAFGEQLGDLTTASAELTLAIRSDTQVDEFMSRLKAAVDAAARAPLLLSVHVRALDVGAFLGQRRFPLHQKILGMRRDLLHRLSALTEQEAEDVGILKWSASWVLNTATLAVEMGEFKLAREAVVAGRIAVDRLPDPKSSYGAADRCWLESRLAQIESRVQTDGPARLRKLRDALESAFGVLAWVPPERQWVGFALRAAKRLSEEIQDDDEREGILAETRQRLVSVLGQPVTWPLWSQAHAAALARDVAAQVGDPVRRLHVVQKALELFEPSAAEALSLARLGDDRPLLVLARSYALAAACCRDIGDTGLAEEYVQDAIRITKGVLDVAPTVGAWRLNIRLVAQQTTPAPETVWRADAGGGMEFRMTPDLRGSIKAAREWLSSVSSWHKEEGQLALSCLKREWLEQGSLELWAARTQDPNEPWDRLAHSAKQNVLIRKYRQRRRELDAVGRKAGPFVDLYVARMRNEAQLQRLLAVYGTHAVDEKPVLGHLDAAKELWPNNHTLWAAEAEYYRYVWNYPAAITTFRRVVAAVSRARDRREAARDLIEVLLTAAMHCRQLTVDGIVTGSSDLVAEARVLLRGLVGFRHISHEIAVLRDRADLEAGVPIDWPAVDAAFAKVIGDVDAYPTTVVDNLEELRARHADPPERVADLVLDEYTNSEVMRGVGSLYLRRAEIGASSDPAGDCRKALAAFSACRVLESAWSGRGKESPTTSYQRGRAILAAAHYAGSATPFSVDLEGKRSLVHLAEALFQRATALSVGFFHEDAKRRRDDAVRLQRSLG